MALADVLRANFERSMRLYDDLLAALPEPALGMKLPGIPSNTIGAQLWCVVGARESYARAIAAGAWSGFSCSLTKADSRQAAAVRAALDRARAAVLDALAGPDLTDDRTGYLIDLLEHEAQHHGQ